MDEIAKITIWLSTDGKHTVQAEVTDAAQGHEALAIVEELYDEIEGKYGQKVDQWKKTAEKPVAAPATQATSGFNPNAPVCPIHKVEMVYRQSGISKTTGKAYPGFWACPEKSEDGKFCNYKPPRD